VYIRRRGGGGVVEGTEDGVKARSLAGGEYEEGDRDKEGRPGGLKFTGEHYAGDKYQDDQDDRDSLMATFPLRA